ncbi:MAG: hypothetical protein AAF376_07470 [Pseudomonadota bacterium]
MGQGKESIAGAAVAAMMLAAPLPASAQSEGRLFSVPAGCEAFLTVQSRSCSVSHYWTCSGDPEGTHWRVSMDQDGPYHLAFTDAEFRWLRSWHLRVDVSSVLIEPEEDPASLTELFATGTDAMVFSLTFEGPQGVAQRNYTGFDSLTGEQVVVDGQPLEVTSFAYEYNTPQGPMRQSGNQFVHRDWRLFFGGVETSTAPDGETVESDLSPMEFAQPGEGGFLSTQPIYDCGDMMSSLEAPVVRVSQ